MDSERREKFQAAWQRRQQAVEAQWQGFREYHEGKSVKSAANELEKQMSKLGLNERMVEDQLVGAWAEVVGPQIANMSRPVQFKRGELIVAVAQPAFKYDLERFHAGEILRRMQDRFGKERIRRLRFRVGN